MSEFNKMNYAQMQAMAASFGKAQQQLDETISVVNTIAEQLEAEALIGEGGTAFVDALRTGLVPSVTRLSAKMLELQGDVQRAEEDMRLADRSSTGRHLG